MDNFEGTNLVRWSTIMMAGQTMNLSDQILEGWPCQDFRVILEQEKQNHSCINDVISAYISDKILWKCVEILLKCNCVVGKP